MKTIAAQLRKPQSLIGAVLLILAASGAGYWLRGYRANEALGFPTRVTPPVEYIYAPRVVLKN